MNSHKWLNSHTHETLKEILLGNYYKMSLIGENCEPPIKITHYTVLEYQNIYHTTVQAQSVSLLHCN